MDLSFLGAVRASKVGNHHTMDICIQYLLFAVSSVAHAINIFNQYF